MTNAFSLKVTAFTLIAVLGLVSSVISAILAAIILVEMSARYISQENQK